MQGEPTFFNRTRRSQSIPLKLLKRGRVLEIPLYFALRQSDLAREGIDHSGSWAFADHIYRGEPSGRGWFGKWLDGRLLSMPSARSFRNRYLAVSTELARFLAACDNGPVHVLSAPCGIPRELARGARLSRVSLERVTFHGLDLDQSVLDRARTFAREQGLPFVGHQGDAFDRSTYPESADFITCTGFGEFLADDQLERLYGIFHDVLRSGGWLVTTAMKRYWASAYLLEMAELDTHYRGGPDLATIVRRAGFRDVTFETDEVGLQAILTARR